MLNCQLSKQGAKATSKQQLHASTFLVLFKPAVLSNTKHGTSKVKMHASELQMQPLVCIQAHGRTVYKFPQKSGHVKALGPTEVTHHRSHVSFCPQICVSTELRQHWPQRGGVIVLKETQKNLLIYIYIYNGSTCSKSSTMILQDSLGRAEACDTIVQLGQQACHPVAKGTRVYPQLSENWGGPGNTHTHIYIYINQGCAH